MLELAASELQTADLTAAEKDALGIFQQRLAKLEALQEERAEQGYTAYTCACGANKLKALGVVAPRAFMYVG